MTVPIPRTETQKRPRVVVVGAGFGGLEAVRALRHVAADVTLVDRRNFHLFQPLLYQVATAALSPGDIAWPIRAIFAGQKNVRVLMMEVNAIDPAGRTISDGSVSIAYDYLVIGTGATHAYFGHDEWEPFAPGLKTIADARAIRERLLLAFERAELTADGISTRAPAAVVVVGGGATGVEMAGAIAELTHRTLAHEFRETDPEETKVILIEAGPRILPAFAEDLAAKARSSLERMGVTVHTDLAVVSCDANGVTTANGPIDASLVVWAAGVHASSAAAWIGAPADRAGRVRVLPDLTVPGHPEVFVIGDTAVLDRPIPGVAPAAKQMGAHAGRSIADHILDGTPPRAFRYRHQGDLATIGRNSAIVSYHGLKLSGRVGWLFWSFVHILFLVGFRSRTVVAINWLWSYLTLQRSIRLISDDDHPPAHDLSARTST